MVVVSCNISESIGYSQKISATRWDCARGSRVATVVHFSWLAERPIQKFARPPACPARQAGRRTNEHPWWRRRTRQCPKCDGCSEFGRRQPNNWQACECRASPHSLAIKEWAFRDKWVAKCVCAASAHKDNCCKRTPPAWRLSRNYNDCRCISHGCCNLQCAEKGAQDFGRQFFFAAANRHRHTRTHTHTHHPHQHYRRAAASGRDARTHPALARPKPVRLW